MLFKALKTNTQYIAGKSYELDESCLCVKNYIAGGVLEPIKKPEATTRRRKVIKPSETK